MRDLTQIIKAYDVRGTVPDQLDAELAQRVGAAFVQVVGAAAADGGPGAIVVGRDMRPTGPDLVAAFCEGATGQGVDVIDIGLASTDQLYFASGRLELPGAMFTASHNPAQYNGIKMCRAHASPVGEQTGLADIRRLVAEAIPAADRPPRHQKKGRITHRDMLADYVSFLHELVDLSGMRRLTVVADAGNGMAGHTAPAVLGLPEIDLIPMYFELDGTFPNHEANPIEPENLVDLQAEVVARGADIGLAFDGDADRCFVVDENGRAVSPSAITALIAANELARRPGATIIHNVITSRTVPEVIAENGGTAVRTRVGHSFIKAVMAESGAVFGGEHSGHFYFADFWRADSGMLAALHTLASLGRAPAGTRLSDLLAPYDRYVASGEINSEVSDQAAKIAEIREAFGEEPDVTFDELDGLTVDGPDWWINVRPSNTEPLLRLNVEAPTQARMEALRDRALGIIRGDGEPEGHPS